MKETWPRIQKARVTLNLLTNIHDKLQASLYEAERHLVEIVKLKPSASAKAKDTYWMKRIMSLSSHDRRELAKVLEGRYEGERSKKNNQENS